MSTNSVHLGNDTKDQMRKYLINIRKCLLMVDVVYLIIFHAQQKVTNYVLFQHRNIKSVNKSFQNTFLMATCDLWDIFIHF